MTILENSQLRARIAPSGRLISLIHKTSGREVISEESGGNRLLLFEDDPVEHEAWDMDVYHLEKFDEVSPASALRVIEEGPLRVGIELEYSVGAKSRMLQRILLAADSPRLDFECEVSWHEWRRYLKVDFACGIRAVNATFEIQFGHLQRPTHFNTSWDIARFEVCGHRWADLAEPDFGVALLNDSKYGYAVHGNVMRLSLLRSPKKPDPQADMGDHAFTYSLMPHTRTFQDAGVITEALNLNMPLHLRGTSRRAESVQWFNGSNPAFIIDTVKQAEESHDIIVRGYEAHGTTGTTRISSSLPVRSAALCNLLEEDEGELTWRDGAVDLSFTPFQIRTIRLALE
jgi:alpha-mannosidase